MLTGRVPFIAEGYGQMLVKHMTEPPPSLTAVRPDLSPHLELVVLKALQKRPDDRYASMRDFATALREPQRFVEASGGTGAFVPAAPLTTPLPARAHSLTGPPLPGSTTLSQSAGELAAAGTVPPGARGGSAKWIVAGAATVVTAAVAIYVVLARASNKPEAAAAKPADPAGDAVAASAPAPTPAPAAAAAPTTTPEPTPPPPVAVPKPPATVRLSFSTKPERAEIYLATGTKPRCIAPCAFEVERTDAAATITIKLAGFADATRVVRLDADANVDVPLTKKHSSRPRSTQPEPARPVGDNTLNPLE